MKNDERPFCPLVKRKIDIADCLTCHDVVAKLLKERVLSDEFKIENYQEICKKCKYFDY